MSNTVTRELNQASMCALVRASMCALSNDSNKTRPTVTLQLGNLLQAFSA